MFLVFLLLRLSTSFFIRILNNVRIQNFRQSPLDTYGPRLLLDTRCGRNSMRRCGADISGLLEGSGSITPLHRRASNSALVGYETFFSRTERSADGYFQTFTGWKITSVLGSTGDLFAETSVVRCTAEVICGGQKDRC